MTTFSSDHIKYHLHYSTEYSPAKLKELVNDGTKIDYLIELDCYVAETLEHHVNKWKVAD